MKFFLFLFLLLVVFNILNVIDKVTTYYGIQQGLGEYNARVSYFFNNYGLLPMTIFQIFFLIVSSILIYLSIIKISERIKSAPTITTIPIMFLIGTYFNAVINNVRLLI